MNEQERYQVLKVDTVPAYIDSRSELARLIDASNLQVREVGDGNLNLIFICQDRSGRGLCLKQALPYVRLVGESWPLTPHRATAEARTYDAAQAACPQLVPQYYGFDAERFVLAMEDLSTWTIWRTALNEGQMHPGVAVQMGEYIGIMSFTTSLFGLEPEKMHWRAAEATNPDLCRITEDLVFTEPYIDHEHNSFVPELGPEVERLRNDKALVAEVGGLKYRFMTSSQALIHGDLHTGSVMVKLGSAGGAQGKAIDGEFSFYGPVGFDLGALIGNYLLALARARALGRPPEFVHWLEGLPRETWSAFEAKIRAQWPSRVDRFFSDEFLESWLRGVWRDAVGFAGCKTIRRIVGLAKVSDIESLPPDVHLQAATIALRTARRWIKERARLETPDALIDLARETAAGLER